jgi:hypothetical protein
MKALAIGLLAVIVLGSGDLTGAANELGYNPPAKIILAECDQNAMRICLQQWDFCSQICRSGDATSQQICWTGCTTRYVHCKTAADCR